MKVDIKIDYNGEGALCQTESPKIKICFLDKDYKNIHVPVKCKDYLNEVVATELDGNARKIYGFSHKKTNKLFVGDTFKMAVIHYKLDDFPQEYIDALLLFLNQCEINRGYKPTTIERTTIDNTIVLNSDIRYLDTPVYLSFYTLMLRIINLYKGEPLEDYLTEYVKMDSTHFINYGDKYGLHVIMPFILYLYNGGSVLQTWEKAVENGTSYLHNETGVKSYFKLYSNNIETLKNEVKQKSVQTASAITAS